MSSNTGKRAGGDKRRKSEGQKQKAGTESRGRKVVAEGQGRKARQEMAAGGGGRDLADWKELIVELYAKYGELLRYLIFGVLGVVVSIVSYMAPRALGLDIVASNIVSWVVSVIFVYVTNRIFVFKSKDPNVVREFLEFISARVLTLIVETGVIYVCAEVIQMHDVAGKVIAQVIIIILNYLLSKFWIFRKGEKKSE